MKKERAATILLLGGEGVLSPEEIQFLADEGFAVKQYGEEDGRDLVLLFIDASGRLDRKEEVRRLFQDAQVPAICIVHPDCADPGRYCSEFPVYGYAVPGSGGPLLSAAIRTALRLAGSPGPGAAPQHPALCGREGEKLFRTFMTNLPVYVFIKDQEGRYIFANEAYRRLGEADPAERIGKTDYELFPPEVAKQITENDEKARRSSEPLETVEEVPYAKTVQTHLVVKFLITPEDQKTSLLGGIAFDITELVKTRNSLRNTLEEKSALHKELQHRVKNSLVMIASLIGIEEKRSSAPQVRTLLRRLKERVYSIAELYKILNKTGGVRAIQLGDYLHREIENIKQAYFPENPNIIIAETLNSASVSVKDAAAYGLIVNELVTNAVKHAFPEGRSGTILIDLEKKKDGIEVKVSDDGIGLPSDFSIEKAGGSGMLLSKVLAEQLGGTFKFEQNDRTVFVLDVPLSG